MNDSRLNLNDKTEFLITGTQRQLDKIKNVFLFSCLVSMFAAVSTINLGVHFHNNFNCKEHIPRFSLCIII